MSDDNLIRDFLEEKYYKFSKPDFIETDPIQVPHSFEIKEDIEIAAFLSATIAWGQRITIIKNAHKIMQLMDNSPFDFVMNVEKSDLQALQNFKHRTFNSIDLTFFIQSLQNIYKNLGGLQTVFETGYLKTNTIANAICYFRDQFFAIPHPLRTLKHVSDVNNGAAAKRINMFLRWMVRSKKEGIDFDLWHGIPASALYLPLDLHTGNVSRKLEILTRKQNDWKAVAEVTNSLKKFDTKDPIKYDFALFSLGIFEKF